MKPWYEIYPDRLKEEFAALEKLGIQYKEDSAVRHHQIIRLHLSIQGNNSNFELPDKSATYSLVAVYPDLYPYFRPEVYAYDLNLPRHQHLFSKNLCLLPRPTEHWDPNLTVAALLHEQLSLVLEKGVVTDDALVAADEAEQAEPVVEYYPVFDFDTAILFDPTPLELSEAPPTAFKEIATVAVGIPQEAGYFSRLAILSIRPTGKSKTELPSAARKMFPKTFQGKLFESPDVPPITDKTNDILAWLSKGIQDSGGKFSLADGGQQVHDGVYESLIGICFPQETEKGKKGRGWIFIVTGQTYPRDIERKPLPGKSIRAIDYIARPAYINSSAKIDRVPRLIPLADKTVAIAGLGALGGFIAVELARCGIKKLKLLDYDIVDPPTTVRWPLGLPAFATFKTDALKQFITGNYLHTEVELFPLKLGNIRVDGKASLPFSKAPHWKSVNNFLDKVDLLVDATAEEGVTNFLFRQAIKKDIPHVILYATPGAWGGLVMRWIPQKTDGCWLCMRNWQTDNEEDPTFVPPVDFDGQIQPPGCGDKSFTGSSFDLQQVSTAAVRIIVSTLCSPYNNGYADIGYDWAVLKMFEKDGSPTVPIWSTHQLKTHPKCSHCN